MDDALWAGSPVWQLVFEDADEEGALALLDGLCGSILGSGVDAKLFGETSVGIVFGLRLRDGRRVVVKAHQPREPIDFLRAVHVIQTELHRVGFPCPLPLAAPASFASTHVTFEELIDDGTSEDARDATIRGAIATTLAWHLEVARQLGVPSGFDGSWRAWGSATLWPAESHSPIFDFVATAAGAEWIDTIASTAKRRFVAGRAQVRHSDWSAKHFRFEGDKVRVVYDWDSLSKQSEEQLVGTAAGTFTANPLVHDGAYIPPTPDEVRMFVDDYSTARHSALSASQRESIHAAATYIVAYSARCEHALGQHGNFSQALREFGMQYLESDR